MLFSAGSERRPGHDVPDTFEKLEIGTLDSGQPRPPGCLHTPTVQQVGTSFDPTGSSKSCVLSLELSPVNFDQSVTRILGRGLGYSFELTGDRGAALVTRHPTFCEDSLLNSRFETYTMRHYESWVEFARHKQFGNDVRPVLISGVDMTRDFAMVAYLNKGASYEHRPIIEVPMFASDPDSFRGTWRTRCLAHTNHGPQQISPPPSKRVGYNPFPSQLEGTGSTATGSTQCVFVRYYTMRSRGPLALFPKVLKAGAGPHDLGPGDSSGKTFPELSVESSAEHMSGDEDFGGQWSPTDGAESEPGVVIQNTLYVCSLLYPFVSTLNIVFRMKSMIAGML